MEPRQPGYEHTNLKGITVKNIIVTITTTAFIVASVLTTYYNLKSDLHDMRDTQDTQNKITEIRLKIMEGQISTLQIEVRSLQDQRVLSQKRH